MQLMPGSFPDPILLRAYAKGEWVFAADFRYVTLDGVVHTAPKHFVMDLASIPWVAEPVFNQIDSRPEGAMHDWFYASQFLPRAVADALFYEMLMVRRSGQLSGLSRCACWRWPGIRGV